MGDMVLAPHVLLHQSYAPGTVTAVQGGHVHVQFYDGIAGNLPGQVISDSSSNTSVAVASVASADAVSTHSTDDATNGHIVVPLNASIVGTIPDTVGTIHDDDAPYPVRISATQHAAIVQRILHLEDAFVGVHVLCRDDVDGRFYHSTVRAHPRAGAWYVVEVDPGDGESPESHTGAGRQMPQLRSHLFTMANQVGEHRDVTMVTKISLEEYSEQA